MHISFSGFSFRRVLFLSLLISLLAITGCATRKKTPVPKYGDGYTNVAVEPSQRGTAQYEGSLYIGKVGSGSHVLAVAKPAEGPVLSPYGMRRHPVLKKRKPHKGIDISGNRGNDIIAAASGTVTFSGWQRGYGKTVEIDHGNGMSTLYAHMDDVFVENGATVKRAEKIGVMGSTGRTTGPNLHFEVKKEGRQIDPLPQSGWTEADTMVALYGKGGKPPSTALAAASSKRKAVKNTATSRTSVQAKNKKTGSKTSATVAANSAKKKTAKASQANGKKKQDVKAVSARKKPQTIKTSVNNSSRNRNTVASAKQASRIK